MSGTMGEIRGLVLPYCLERVSEGHYAILNRAYKPLGMHSNTAVDYADHAIHIKGMTPTKADALDYRGKADETGRIYLYNDGSVPTSSDAAWKAYAARLQKLAKMKLG